MSKRASPLAGPGADCGGVSSKKMFLFEKRNQKILPPGVPAFFLLARRPAQHDLFASFY
jgi:hypothetical protein